MDLMSQEENFLNLINRYEKMILKVAGIYCRNEEERKDLAQEIILHLWKAFPSFDENRSTSTWLYRIALNVSISYVRKTATRDKALQGYKSLVQLVHFDDHGFQEKLNRLYDAIKFLKPLDKAIIGLHLESCKNYEIAEVLGITTSNVSTRISRIKEKLKKEIKHS